MKLPLPHSTYDMRAEIERNRRLEAADAANHKRGQAVEIGGGQVILTAPDGGRWAITISNAGALGTVAV